MEFAQINDALAKIKKDLDEIDLTQEVKKAEDAAKRAISQMDKITLWLV